MGPPDAALGWSGLRTPSNLAAHRSAYARIGAVPSAGDRPSPAREVSDDRTGSDSGMADDVELTLIADVGAQGDDDEVVDVYRPKEAGEFYGS